MKSRSWAVTIIVLIAASLAGCANGTKEIKPVELARVDDADKTQFKQIDLSQASEVDLVEELARARADYKRLLAVLRQWYLQNGYFDKSQWAAREMEDLLRVRTYPYLVVIEPVELPPTPATTEVVEANKLFEDAKKLYEEGEILPLINSKPKLKQALDRFRRIVREYPNSTVAPDAAFFAGEILKEHFDENLQAIEYYKLALKLNPEIRRKVRFQLAVIYDYRLHDRAKALEMYRRVLAEEADIDRTNTAFATTRIKQLVKEQQAEQSLESQRRPITTESATTRPSSGP